ncbi:MAG TPA: hypothetical protein PKW06_01000 [Cyclobacteriaceae bacterium]|nr:hypothetical protein [Cyclobacteriaceae bacterium]MCB9239261.1 hypothetical protein [Flammeovirgaceae bacterium]MCB0500532.1 hypothetical protein [Cyclobacteriaceae bacterium]MCO5272413.1 hypothetical protein [Cyclobacteriaceae bacterium]MCW5903306.1 hypothetical protein [Cyclobacteriaceae bacterium]
MSIFEQAKIETDLRKFTDRNFESPRKCKNPDQVKFYVRELCTKIEEYEKRFNYVPTWAYSLLAQYNKIQNEMVYMEFVRAYR